MAQKDPRDKLTDALVDSELKTDMLSNYTTHQQKRYDAALAYGSLVYGIRFYDELLKVDRRQQMGMVSRNTKPRSEQLKEAMVAGSDRNAIYTGTRGVNDGMDEYQARRKRDSS